MIPVILVLYSLYLTPGHSWTANWNDGHNRTLYPTDLDPFEKAKVEFSGDGSAYLNGKGHMSLTGFAPRYRVLEKFHNVNVTIYAKRIDEVKKLDFAGFQIGARSQHYTDATCGANTYYGQITYDGRATFEKELFHGRGSDAFYPKSDVFAFKDGVPFNQWIGIRFVIKDVNQDAQLQLYVDKEANGNWEKILDYTDNGNWDVDSDHAKCDGYYPENKIISQPGFVFIRNDGLGRADYRDLTIKELP